MSNSISDICQAPLHPRAAEGLRLIQDREIFGKVTDQWAEGDPNERTNRHGYAYGVRF